MDDEFADGRENAIIDAGRQTMVQERQCLAHIGL